MAWWNTFYNKKEGDIVTIIRNYNALYKVNYIGASSNSIKYIVPSILGVRYLDVTPVVSIKYIGESSSKIRYIEPSSIKIKYTCKP